MNNPTTPSSITTEIIEFCSCITSVSTPVFVPIIPSPTNRFNYCMTDVPAYATQNGGKVQLGWTIWEMPQIFLEAEFHAVWIKPDGALIDVTPKPDRESQILFLPDYQRMYEGKLVENIRKPLIDNKYTRTWLLIEKKRFEIRKKHCINGLVNGSAVDFEFKEWIASLKSPKG